MGWISLILTTLAGVMGWLFGRIRYEQGYDEGRRMELQRQRELHESAARVIQEQSQVIADRAKEVRETIARDLKTDLGRVPTPAEIEDLLRESKEASP